MITYEDAINKAYLFTGNPRVNRAYNTPKEFIFLMVPEDVNDDDEFESGTVWTAVLKESGKAYFYDILSHLNELTDNTRLYPKKEEDK